MATDSSPEKSKQSPLGIIVLTLLVGLAVGAGAMTFLGRKQAPSDRPDSQQPVKAVLHLEPFTLNMSDPEQKMYLRLGVDLGLERDPKKDQDGGEPPTALVRDTILTVLMATKPEDFVAMDGKLKLKAQILHALQERAPELAVREVYFTEFLMQR